MRNYLGLLEHIMCDGCERGDRTGTGTRGVFGAMLRWNLDGAFPILTTKRVYMRGVIHELLWFLSGNTNIQYLVDNNVHIWDEWALEEDYTDPSGRVYLKGDIGPMYGKMMRAYPTAGADGEVVQVDQLRQVIDNLRTNPHSRRHVVVLYHPGLVPDESVSPQDNVKAGRQSLACCHHEFQFYVDDANRLSLKFSQRSVDSFLGLPFNISSYAVLCHAVANELGYGVGDLVFMGGDVHIYKNHFEQVRTQLARKPLGCPKLGIRAPVGTPVEQLKFEDFYFIDEGVDVGLNYRSHEPIKAPISK